MSANVELTIAAGIVTLFPVVFLYSISRRKRGGQLLLESRLNLIRRSSETIEQLIARVPVLAGVDMSGLDLTRANLAFKNLSEVGLSRTKLDEADLSGAILDRAVLSNASLQRARAKGASFIASDLRGADLSEGDFRGATFARASLRHARLRGADLRDADFSGSVLDQADLEGALLDGARLDEFQERLGIRPRGSLQVAVHSSGERVLPVWFVIDTSASMFGADADLAGQALSEFHTSALDNPVLSSIIWMGILTFSDRAEVLVPLTSITEIRAVPLLLPGGATFFSPALNLLIEQVRRAKQNLRAMGHAVYRPLIFFVTDGEPLDSGWERDALVLREDIGVNLVAVGLKDVSPATLQRLSPDLAFQAEDLESLSEALRELPAMFLNSTFQELGSGSTVKMPATPHFRRVPTG